MKRIAIAFVIFLASLSCSAPIKDQSKPEASPAAVSTDDAVIIPAQASEDSLKGSLRARAEGQVGNARIAVRYHSPAVRGRVVWGGLVPFDEVWVTGAHMATSLEVNHPILIGGKSLQPGKYAFFTIPGRETWTLVINSNWQQHLTDDYEAKDDLVRLNVQPLALQAHQERLQYSILSLDERSGKLVMRWEKVEVAMPFRVGD